MTGSFKLDRLDLRILSQLQKNGRISNVDLADAVGLSPSPCLIRVKRLEQAGYIGGYGAQLRLEKLGDTLTVFTEVTLSDHHREEHQDQSEKHAVDRHRHTVVGTENHLVSADDQNLPRFPDDDADQHEQQDVEAAVQNRASFRGEEVIGKIDADFGALPHG